MKKEWIVFWVLLFSASHFLHYKWNQMNSFLYNTVFSLPQTPKEFYTINIGESRKEVEKRIGKALSQEGNKYYYSEKKSRFEINAVWFSVTYDHDTVASRRVFFDD